MNKSLKEKKYEQIAGSLALQINNGTFQAGDQLPSVRKLSHSLNVSTTTVEQSYILLEGMGLVQAKPQSGYFVRNENRPLPEIEFNRNEPVINTYEQDELIAKLYKGAQIPGVVQLGPAYPSTEILPGKKLNHILGTICRDKEPKGISYQFPPGNYELRKQIAMRSCEWGRFFSPDDIVITSGVAEAMNISLKAVAKQGDYLITESPTSFATLQIIESFGMKALELPTHPRDGIDIASVREALKKYDNIAGLFICSTNSNPLGNTMPDANKKELYELFAAKDIPIIEDDVYGDLYFQENRSIPIKNYDEKGIVIYCSSFSKTIAPGYRVGWMYPGKYYEDATKLKILTSYATNSLAQMAIAEFLRSGGYDRCLRNLRQKYKTQVAQVTEFINKYFPEGTKLSRPQGGFFLWLKLPENIDAEKLYGRAIKEKISIAPGPMFTTSKNFNNYIRISCGLPMTPEIEKSIQILGDLCKDF